MARRLLLTALLAALAVALPTVAQEDASASGSVEQGCLLPDLAELACLPNPDPACIAWGDCPLSEADQLLVGAEFAGHGVRCAPWDLNVPNSSRPLQETLILDFDCIRYIIDWILDPPIVGVSVWSSLPDTPLFRT